MAFCLLLDVMIRGCDSGSFSSPYAWEGLACPLLRVSEPKAGKIPPHLSVDLNLPRHFATVLLVCEIISLSHVELDFLEFIPGNQTHNPL